MLLTYTLSLIIKIPTFFSSFPHFLIMQTEQKRSVQKSKTFHYSPSNFHIFSINGLLSKKLISSKNRETFCNSILQSRTIQRPSLKLNLGMTKLRTRTKKQEKLYFSSTSGGPKQTRSLYIVFSFATFSQQDKKKKKIRKEMTNLHAEEDLFLSLELGENGDKIGFEQAGHVGADEPVEADRVGLEPLELLGHD